MEKYIYSPADYKLECASWENARSGKALSKFDMRLRDKWDAVMAAGHFRYNLDHVLSRVIAGPERFVTKLNLKRGTQRRVPQTVDSLNMPYNPDKFNFTKVKSDEVLFQLCPQESPSGGCNGDRKSANGRVCGSAVSSGHVTGTNGNAVSNGFGVDLVTNCHREEDHVDEGRHLMLINVSPLGYGHTLVVCDVDNRIHQTMTLKAHKMAIELALLSNHPGFRIGFNSLCALASVNHQHFHTWYMEEPLTIETAPTRSVCAGLYEMTGKPTRALVLQLHGQTLEEMARMAFTITDFYQKNEVAHNVFLTRGAIIGSDPSGLTVRVYIWPRRNVLGMKNECGDTIFNVAVAELAGFIPMYVADAFERITEEEIIEIIQRNLLPDAEFDRLRDRVAALLTSQ